MVKFRPSGTLNKDVAAMLILLGAILSAFLKVAGQTPVQGIVVDRNSLVPLPFVSIGFEGTSRGTISNPDGKFQIILTGSEVTSLRFSSVGYEPVRISLPVQSPLQVEMNPSVIELPEVLVTAAKGSWVYDLVARSIHTMRKNKTLRTSRAFLTVETSLWDQEPLEVLEAFYQSMVSVSDGVKEMDLKNGRFGLLPVEGLYFLNLNTADILRTLPFLYESDARIPVIPFALSRKEIRKRFSFRIDSVLHTEGRPVAVVGFHPRSDPEGSFEGTVFIDTTTGEMERVILHCLNASIHPWVPIDSDHEISQVDLHFTFNFRKDIRNKTVYDYVECGYRFTYLIGQKTYKIGSKSVLVMYDYDEPFDMPLYTSSPRLNDYEKILSLPFNRLFWERNHHIPASETAARYTDFFRREGLTVNYEPHDQRNRFLPCPVVFWSPDDSLSWTDIPLDNPGWIRFSDQALPSDETEKSMEKKYFLDFQILLDFNKETDTCYWQTQSILQLGGSFWGLTRDSLAMKAIHLEFDLTEMYRRKLDLLLNRNVPGSCDARLVGRVYDDLTRELERQRFLLRRDVKRGSNLIECKKWNRWIYGQVYF